ncbi:hypothetical protein GGG87_03585 [Streptococcus sp. zg-86]|uniref:Uncharacterized protein n=2 Tax=Streptococcus zhangguiae TaxID=2664091 RepID=A0A6I4RT71_9STRE|nr:MULTISPECIES: hypothetical protein [unclassified Streptococcus]MTB64084.1 hypothetical protein [Streptococcus sp. zg-86]MTB90590.1 hypothetical protein [Streptococcus sp. zg-36]MWV56072.1 hypothetical protein [Streptococcus sp. zg-70]QTH48299.1 hypothetical protein J5M87_02935 [Streptococcus sp. zg-86]
MYANATYYTTEYLGTYQGDDLKKRLAQVADKVDSLTFNRIKGVGFENLTPFQQSVIQKVCCQLLDFEVENADLLATAVSSYSINGVSMQFGDSWNVVTMNGIAMNRSTYELLRQTGLTGRAI